jgi:hypothetical protein
MNAAHREADRLYQRATQERTDAAIEDAIQYHQGLGATLEPSDTDTAFEYASRLRALRSMKEPDRT